MKKLDSTPVEYSSVCPYLLVEDLEKQMQFLSEVFQAKEKERMTNEEGILFHGEVIIGEVVIMLGKSREEWPARQSMNYIFVKDVDKIFEKAIRFGAGVIMLPGNREYGLREAGFSDIHQNQWWIAAALR